MLARPHAIAANPQNAREVPSPLGEGPLALTSCLLVAGSSGGLRIGESCASATVPISLDSVTTGLITMHGCYVAEKAAVGSVLQQMASNLDGIASFQVFTLNADAEKSAIARGLHSPDGRLTFLIFNFNVEPGMRDKIMDFGDRAFHRCPFRCVVVAVGMVRQERHHRQKCTNSCKLQGFDQHGPPYVNIIITLPEPHRLNAAEAVAVREISIP